MARTTEGRTRRARARERRRLSVPEKRERRDPDRKEGSEYLYVIATANALAAGFPFVLGAALLGKGYSEYRGQQRELLSAIRDNGGSITLAEAAMETTLTVREADRMLPELAGEGHLAVKRRSGALYYSLPGRSELEVWRPSASSLSPRTTRSRSMPSSSATRG